MSALDVNYPFCGDRILSDKNGYDLGPTADPKTSWLRSTPTGIRPLLTQLQNIYHPPDITVSEFGFAEPFENLLGLSSVRWDLRRTDLIQGLLDGILAAMYYDKVGVWNLLGTNLC